MLFVADSVSSGTSDLSKDMGGIATHNSLEAEADSAAPAASSSKESKAEQIKTKVSTAVKKAVDPEHRRKQLSRLTTGRLMVLLMPVVLYVAVQAQFRGLAFVLGFMFSLMYVMRLHLGVPVRKISTTGFAAIPSGRMVIHFPVDLARLIRYLEMKREETDLDVSITHLVIKGCGVSISEIPQLNGHIIGGDFYPTRTDGVDISVSLESIEGDTTFIKVRDADRKPVAYVADELLKQTEELQSGNSIMAIRQQRISQIVNLLPNIVGFYVKWTLSKIGTFGFTISSLGVEGFPHGVCTVVSVPHAKDKQHESGGQGVETDLSITLVPQMTDSTAPITVSIAGVSMIPAMDKEKKVSAAHVLNISVAIDTNAGSLANCRKFCTRLQHYLNNPALLDKIDRMTTISKEDEKIAEEKAAAKAALYKKGGSTEKK